MAGAEEIEGIIHFQYELSEPLAKNGIEWGSLAERMAGWRKELLTLGVLGRDPSRYGGAAFGNISARLASSKSTSGVGDSFLVSASQTSGLSARDFSPETHLVEIVAAWPEKNRCRARGHRPPSSESLTHAAIYRQNPQIVYVFHGHHPGLYAHFHPDNSGRRKARADWTPTASDYGTPEIAAQAGRFFGDPNHHNRLLFLTGHQDGFVCAGNEPKKGLKTIGQALADLAKSPAGP